MRYKSKLICISFVASMYVGSITAQPIDPAINKDAPRFIPPAPNAAALTKYSGVDVALNTGMVKYDIPLYTLSAGKLSLPISISYSSNGVRVDEFPSLTGMSWVLNAGGVITRQLNGARDETADRQELNESWSHTGQDMYNYIMNNGNLFWGNAYDSEPDVFSFNFLNYSGKFVLNDNGNAVLLPHGNLKIETNFSSSIYTFKITDPYGVKYYFGGNGATETSYSNNTAYASSLPHPIYIKNAFYLTKIEHPIDGLITFTYDDYYHEMDRSGISQSIKNTLSSAGCSPPCPASQTISQVESYTWYNSKILSQITVQDWATIQFNYSAFNFLNLSSGNNGALKLLTSFYVYDSKGYNLRTVSFVYDYHVSGSTTKRAFLSTISSGNEFYNFEYYSPGSLPAITSFSQDHWGFYNGKSNGSNFISNESPPVYFSGYVTADRSPDATYAYFGMLKKIIYPTGGNNEIEYEGNTRNGGGSIGGMRVKKIKAYDGVSATPMTRRFYYQDRNGGNSGGYSASIVLDRQHTSGAICGSAMSTCTYAERSSSPVNNSGIYNGNIIAYEYVTESLGGDNYEQGGIEHRFRVSYNDYGTTVINGSIYDSPVGQTSTYHGSELQTKAFRKNGTQVIVLSETTNNYTTSTTEYFQEVKGWRVNIRYDLGLGFTSGFDVVKYSYKSYWERLESTVTTNYDQDGTNGITVTKNYFYNNNTHLQVTKIETYDSQGNLLKSEFKYPADFTSQPPSGLYTDMISRNMITPVIEQKTYSGSALQETTQMVHKYVNSTQIVPDVIKRSLKSHTLETHLQYDAYDQYGNPTQFTTQDGVPNTYIWDYKHNLAIAEIKNATPANVAYNSFEADGKGGWSFSGLCFTEGTAPTGIKAYALVTGNISKTGLNSSTYYIVSYWSKSGSQYINGTTANQTTGRTLNGWTYYERRLAPSSSAITISGSGIIDELRLYPDNAFMSTTTYEPLVGVTSQCDVNNRITYYEYDSYQRLMLVRDQDKKIIRKLCYNYSGQTENCTIYYNAELNEKATRDNCPNNDGQGIDYIVAAGTYSSTISQADADAKAWNDYLLNSQVYANMLGPCGSSSCSPENCVGVDKKCVNGVCETGVRVKTGSRQLGPDLWECTYRYEWSDGSWSQEYTIQTTSNCMLHDL